jgi:hypothetical protein
LNGFLELRLLVQKHFESHLSEARLVFFLFSSFLNFFGSLLYELFQLRKINLREYVLG